jgi:hypothetical protein
VAAETEQDQVARKQGRRQPSGYRAVESRHQPVEHQHGAHEEQRHWKRAAVRPTPEGDERDLDDRQQRRMEAERQRQYCA